MSAQQRILVLGSDREQRSLLASMLSAGDHFAVVAVNSAARAIEMIDPIQRHINAIVVDLNHSDDGALLCKRLRGAGVRVPIVLLAVDNAEDEVVRSLDSGADDSIAKPIGQNELQARLRAHIRTHLASEDAVFAVGRYRFRSGDRTLTDSVTSRRLRLTVTEAAILKSLHRAGNAPVARETLLRDLWGEETPANCHALETHVYRLRQKIDPGPSAGRRIVLSVPGGYRMVSGNPLDAMMALQDNIEMVLSAP